MTTTRVPLPATPTNHLVERLLRWRARIAALLAALVVAAAAGACSANGGSDSGTASESAGSGAGSTGSSGGDAKAAPGTSAEDAASADEASGGDTAQTATGPTSPDLERSVIATGTVSLTSDDVSGARREVQRVVDAQGGRVTEESTEAAGGAGAGTGTEGYARLVVRVPSARFDDAMKALEQVATLRSSTRGSEDVTTQVIDTRVRVRAQEASLERVETLLAEAADLKDVIWIESQLTSRQAELDSLKSQQAWLADQTSLSTITVDITDAEVADLPDDEPAGFVSGLRSGVDALAASITVVLTVLGAVLPFALLIAALGVPLWLVVRRRRTAGAAPQG